MTKETSIQKNELEIFADMYQSASLNFGIDPIAAPKHMQKKIVKWIKQVYSFAVRDFHGEAAAYFFTDSNDTKLLEFLHGCTRQLSSMQEQRKQDFEQAAAGLNAEARAAIWLILQDEPYRVKVIRCGYDAELLLGGAGSCRISLILKQVDAVSENPEGFWLSNTGFTFEKEKNRYTLYGDLENYEEEETSRPIALCFADAEIKAEVFNCCDECATYFENPWDLLVQTASAISGKSDFSKALCNDAELALLPLLEEICAIGGASFALPERKKSEFSEFKALASDLGFEKIERLLCELENKEKAGKKPNRTAQRITTLLCDKKYEALWRAIFEKIQASQAEYHSTAESFLSYEVLSQYRKNIERLMHGYGYCGSYPDFVKTGRLSGVHIAKSYGISYFLVSERKAVYRIHCYESADSDFLWFKFLCTASFLKKDEKADDVYSALFNAKGRRLFKSVDYMQCGVGNEMPAISDLEGCVEAAVKYAELKRLSKQEKEKFCPADRTKALRVFFFTFLFGGFFGIFMTLGFMLLAVIEAVFDGQGQNLSSILSDFPWLFTLGFSWIGFGGLFGLSMALSNRR